MRLALQKITAYIAAFVLLAANTPAHAQSASGANEADLKEVYAYSLSMDKITKIVNITNALKDWTSNNPQVSQSMDSENSIQAGTFSDRAKAMEAKFPQAAEVIRKNGMPVREYMVAFTVVIAASMLVKAKKSGQIQDYSKAAGFVSEANLNFVEQHWDAVEKLTMDVPLPEAK